MGFYRQTYLVLGYRFDDIMVCSDEATMLQYIEGDPKREFNKVSVVNDYYHNKSFIGHVLVQEFDTEESFTSIDHPIILPGIATDIETVVHMTGLKIPSESMKLHLITIYT